jgi:UDP-N-acetylglucosamine 4,6-dehydratase
MDWKDKVVLLTGGTGSFGRKFTETMLKEHRPRKVIVFSRDELKQHEMRASGVDDPILRYFIGDVRDVDRLRRAMRGVDIVVHAAALKQVPACEYNPIEAVLTNVMGARNIIDAAVDCGVSRVLALSTDKAVSPVNLYGATKLVAEKLFVQANAYGGGGTRFSCVRYGNVVGSRGSVIPLFLQQRRTGTVTITDARMTRFWITLDQGVRFVARCVEEMHGGELFVPKLRAMSMMDLVKVLAPDCRVETIGIRPGEKLHEALISEEEAARTVEVDGMLVVQPSHPWWQRENWTNGKPLPAGFQYVSNSDSTWLSVGELKQMVGEIAA